MAVPKRRMSRSNTRSRRSQWKATVPQLVPVTVAGTEYQVPRRIVAAVRRGLIDPNRL
ncbi:50S ribosomal protein L32 [Nocardia camponoti]|uniref:50S ribosomal protein L32 n=1 Tax=Nocardia camponoti TaxID=1616106 RepID=UPI0016699F74|nr:50S ribosomal protein L32 [Nocardia camponoti]